MDFKKLAQQAKSAVDKRGGTESLKEDFAELKDIAKGKGSLTDKAKEAAAVIKEPGAPEPEAATPPVSPSPEPDASTGPKPDPEAAHSQHRGQQHGQVHHRHEPQ